MNENTASRMTSVMTNLRMFTTFIRLVEVTQRVHKCPVANH